MRTEAAKTHAQQAVTLLLHYFRLAIPDLSPDAETELYEVVDAIIEAAIAEAEPSFRRAFDAIRDLDAAKAPRK